MHKQPDELASVAAAYGWKDAGYSPAGAGLINSTWKVLVGDKTFVLQAVNTQVFPHPGDIDHNLHQLSDYIRQHHPGYLFTSPIPALNGQTLLSIDDKYYRVFDWIPNSHTVDLVTRPEHAYEAARAFGYFTFLFNEFDATSLRITLPHFHDLALRYQQFEQALINGNSQRIRECGELIAFLTSQHTIVQRFTEFIHHPEATQRVTHHDTKISNILFDTGSQAICVIDLDTVMPGYFLSDVGDMFRTYTCSVSEEEADLAKIIARKEYVTGVVNGYLDGTGNSLSRYEQDHIYLGGEMLIYMQSLRFLTDYLENDRYYGSRYPGHNKIRAENQGRLLTEFQKII